MQHISFIWERADGQEIEVEATYTEGTAARMPSMRDDVGCPEEPGEFDIEAFIDANTGEEVTLWPHEEEQIIDRLWCEIQD